MRPTTLLVVGAAALVLHLGASSLRADRVTLEKPVQLPTIKADKKPLDGRLVAYDDDGFELVQGKNKTVTVRWDELGPPGLYNVRSTLLGPKATGEQWLDLGRRMLEVEGGAPFADRAFARAVKLEPNLKGDVEAAKSPSKAVKPKTAAAKDARDAGDKADGSSGDGAEGQSGAGTTAGPQVVGTVDAKTWGPLSDEQQAAMVKQLKAFADGAGKKLNKKLTLNETKYFLFYSDLPPDQAANWAGLLDRMYGRLAELFGVAKESAGGASAVAASAAGAPVGPSGATRAARRPAAAGGAFTNVWYGKALVFVFKDANDYRRFQVLVHRTDPGTSAGMCHCFGDGRVHIAFYRQPQELTFAHVLVHESVHGFVHRFKSPDVVPSWANEGLAEVIAEELVPRPGRTNERAAIARSVLQQYGGMGGMLDGRHIAGWQYPVAETLCAFMIRQNKKNYVDFVVGIKEGLTWEQSLEQRYKAPRDRLVRAYGESLGVKGLKE